MSCTGCATQLSRNSSLERSPKHEAALAVDLAAVPDFEDFDDAGLVVHAIQNAVIALPHAISVHS